MTVAEIEKEVQSLPADELVRFTQWFDAFRNRTSPGLSEMECRDMPLTVEQQAELERRMKLAREHPESIESWEGTVEDLRRELDAYRAEKAARRST